jgi:hypothetical protein
MSARSGPWSSGASSEIVAHAETEKDRFKRLVTQKIEAYLQNKVPVMESNPAR